MRRIIAAAVLTLAAQSASAADMPDLPILRGSFAERPVVQRPLWQGFYVGGQASLGSSDIDFTNANQALTAKMMYGTVQENTYNVSQWPLMGPTSQRNKGFGGFAGYNVQFDDAIVGVEANYIHGNSGASSSGSMSRFFTGTDGYTYGITSEASAQMKITDMGSLRVRGGYAWNFLMPYGFVGVAVGLGSLTQTSHVYGVQVNANGAPGFQNVPYDDSVTETKNNRIMYGYSAGFGVDMIIAAGLFGRLEWEYTKFANPVETTINTVRAGVGYKF